MCQADGLLPCVALAVLVLAASPLLLAACSPRGTPAPLAGHPGNMYLAGEEVSVPVPDGAVQWKVSGIDGETAASGRLEAGQDRARLGALGTGWYRVEFLDGEGKQVGWTTSGVLARQVEPVPADSPVCADSATAWFARHYEDQEKNQEIIANLAALAGINWIRDRMAWGEIEKEQGKFEQDTIYDSSAALQAKHGLKVLQVFHSTPGWAIDKKLDGRRAWGRFPRDLRHHYAFCKVMAKRLEGRVLAWEPWNEANIEPFGGHTIDEMCSMQKAAYFGLKAADAGVTICWNVYAGSGSRLHTEGVIANEAWPYFETYNIHSYATPDRYLNGFATAREAACGRPIWITECGIRVMTEDKKPWGDLPREVEREQGEFVAKSFASSLFAGVDRHFYFILGNYIENGVQFGLLRHDHSPRPGFVALAVVGRFLSGARCLGRLSPTVYAFRARPDGAERDVLVAWGEGKPPFPPGLRIEAVYDHVGRHLGTDAPETLRSSAAFVILPAGEAEKLELEAPPERSALREGSPSPVVLQVSLPDRTKRLRSQSHVVGPGERTELPLFVYNFGDQPVTGTLSVEQVEAGLRAEVSEEPVRVEPMGRERIRLTATMPETGRDLMNGAWVKLRGDFGSAGWPVLAFRLSPDPAKLRPAETRPLAGSDRAETWQENIVRGGKLTIRRAEPSGVGFEMQFPDAEPWGYPRIRLAAQDAPANSFDGLALTVRLLEGVGTVRVQFVEECGAAYLAEVGIDPDLRSPQRALVLFRSCRWGSYSKRDPDGRLQPANIRAVLVGINSKRNSKVEMEVSGLEWVRF